MIYKIENKYIRRAALVFTAPIALIAVVLLTPFALICEGKEEIKGAYADLFDGIKNCWNGR